MEYKLVLNNRTYTYITNNSLNGVLHQQLKYFKFGRVPTKKEKTVIYLFVRKEEDTYFALREAKSMKHISLVHYPPSNFLRSELPFRPFPPKHMIDLVRWPLRKHISEFNQYGMWMRMEVAEISEIIFLYSGTFQDISSTPFRTNHGAASWGREWSVSSILSTGIVSSHSFAF